LAQPIVYFEIVGRDADSLRSYYADLFGWRFDGAGAPRAFERAAVTDDAGIAAAIGSAPSGTDGYLTFYVAVADVEATLTRAEELGGVRLYGPDRVSDTLELGILADPEGHLIGVLAGER